MRGYNEGFMLAIFVSLQVQLRQGDQSRLLGTAHSCPLAHRNFVIIGTSIPFYSNEEDGGLEEEATASMEAAKLVGFRPIPRHPPSISQDAAGTNNKQTDRPPVVL